MQSNNDVLPEDLPIPVGSRDNIMNIIEHVFLRMCLFLLDWVDRGTH